MASFVETHGHAVDEKHFEALYETYRADVQRLASYLLKNATDAEDAAQTVFLNVLRALRQGVTPADPRAWLLAITRNVCFSRHRAAAARPVLVELEPDEAAGPNGDETPSAEEIVGALARLLPNQRTALILRDFRGVSRAEISELMELSPVAVEALLTRARTAFREELEAGEQPFVCAETRKLVEDQLDGLITVADRHSLRSHLRHCPDCSTLARAVRSSRGKLAGLIFWPIDLVSRLAAAFSQTPAVAHVAAAVTSTAAVATIAIPAAISNGPSLAHVEGRVAPAPVVAAEPAPSAPTQSAPARSASARSAPARSAPAKSAAAPVVTQPPAATVAWYRAVPKAPTPTHVRTRPKTHHAVHLPPVRPSAAPPSPQAPPPSTSFAGSVHTLSPITAHPTAPTTSSADPRSPSGITPRAAAPPRSSSPASKPSTKPSIKPKPKSKPKARPKPSRKSGKRSRKGRHEPAPPSQVPASQPPVVAAAPSGDGAATVGPGIEIGTAAATPAVVASSNTSSAGTTGSSQDSKDKGKDKNDNGNASGDHGKHH